MVLKWTCYMKFVIYGCWFSKTKKNKKTNYSFECLYIVQCITIVQWLYSVYTDIELEISDSNLQKARLLEPLSCPLNISHSAEHQTLIHTHTVWCSVSVHRKLFNRMVVEINFFYSINKFGVCACKNNTESVFAPLDK